MIAPLQNVLAQRAGAPQPMPGQPMQPGAPVGTAMPAQPRPMMPMQGAPIPGQPLPAQPMPVGTAMQPQRPPMSGMPQFGPQPPALPSQNALAQRAQGFY